MSESKRQKTDGTPDVAYSREYYAPKKRTGLFIALLFCVLTPVAFLFASWTPEQDAVSTQLVLWTTGEEARGEAVGGLMDIEDAWAIEDARAEAADALVSRMFNGEAILGHDRESRTFYCTIGAGLADWPETALSAMGAEGLQVAWIDDYTYDFCDEAVAEGYRYELLAYTDTAFEYVGVVFTGLPIVTLHTDEGAGIVSDADVGADVHIASAEHGALYSRALVHKRGGGSYVGIPKDSYRLEFRGINARGSDVRMERGVLDMEADSDWLLIANASDVSAVRNHLCWQAWKDWKPERQFAELESRLVEVFRGDEYMGLYQLMQYVNPEKELRLMGGNPDTDTLVRMITLANAGDRPRLNRVDWDNHELELRYAPKGMSAGNAFALYDAFSDVEILRTQEMSDEEFAAIMKTHFDMQDLIDYFLFIQMYGLTDNVTNNLYVWALHGEDGVYRYRLSPWDMDQSLGSEESRINPGEMASWEMKMVNRMLDMNLNGCRDLMWDMFYEKRGSVLSDDAIYQWLIGVEEEINATGAYLRESGKWRGGEQALDLGEMRVKVMEFQRVFESSALWFWPPEDAQETS